MAIVNEKSTGEDAMVEMAAAEKDVSPQAPEATSDCEPVMAADEGAPKSNRFTFAVIIFALILAMFLVALDMTIIATAIPRITDEFHSLDEVAWYGSAFFLGLASF
ncbi:Major facilitator superfamily domain general substrate transporter [Macrophomina phaseolina MS6]|uniref:Major facilitator superfamily domain general substrate transporter n=1 Tax=Macrophomina phaseolina (strain MS6) TaxID=1126212 RepID=K2SHF8_MACPH|nr:Major facilitator superfamily domain general substrate transporter [Macrophomina phaseolina MS6]